MNYIGSKYSLIDFLETTMTEVTGYRPSHPFVFGDLFAGTGIVGQTFKSKGCKVISNDIQYYSYVINRHLIGNVPKLNAGLLDHLNALAPVQGFLYQNYCEGSGSGRNYFTDYNGMKCDAIRMEIERLYRTGEIDANLYFYYLASLIHSIDKYANTASVYGAFLKHIKKSAQREFRLELLPVVPGPVGEVYNEDANRLITKVGGDVLYLDPPYNERQYCSNYHVLETIARYDNPELRGLTGQRDSAEQKSSYCSKRRVAESFEDLIRNAGFPYIFLSYNNEGLMSSDTVREIMSRYGEYRVFSKEYRRFKADKEGRRRRRSDSTKEFLHCLVKQ